MTAPGSSEPVACLQQLNQHQGYQEPNTAYFTASLSRRMNTFHSFSSPMVVRPVVILLSCTSLARRAMAELSGSTDLANATLPPVYSCPLYTIVSSGSVASFESAACISSPVPSKKRPQPPE